MRCERPRDAAGYNLARTRRCDTCAVSTRDRSSERPTRHKPQHRTAARTVPRHHPRLLDEPATALGPLPRPIRRGRTTRRNHTANHIPLKDPGQGRSKPTGRHRLTTRRSLDRPAKTVASAAGSPSTSRASTATPGTSVHRRIHSDTAKADTIQHPSGGWCAAGPTKMTQHHRGALRELGRPRPKTGTRPPEHLPQPDGTPPATTSTHYSETTHDRTLHSPDLSKTSAESTRRPIARFFFTWSRKFRISLMLKILRITIHILICCNLSPMSESSNGHKLNITEIDETIAKSHSKRNTYRSIVLTTAQHTDLCLVFCLSRLTFTR